MSMTTKNEINKWECGECQAKTAISGKYNLVKCLTHEIPCQHLLPFGFEFFCMHPQRKEIAERTEAIGFADGNSGGSGWSKIPLIDEN
jgi:hypothetical protein